MLSQDLPSELQRFAGTFCARTNLSSWGAAIIGSRLTRKEPAGDRKVWRRGWESNPRVKVLQTSPLPLGYRASKNSGKWVAMSGKHEECFSTFLATLHDPLATCC